MTMPTRSENSSSRGRKPVQGVRKPAARKPSGRRASAGKRPTKGRKATTVRTMPAWMRWSVVACLTVVLTAGFYWFFIRFFCFMEDSALRSNDYLL